MKKEISGTLDSSRTSQVFLAQSLWHVLRKSCQEEVIFPQCSEFHDSEKLMLNAKAKSAIIPVLISTFPVYYSSPHTGAGIDFIKILDLMDPGTTHVPVKGNSVKLNSLHSSILIQVSHSSEKPSSLPTDSDVSPHAPNALITCVTLCSDH